MLKTEAMLKKLAFSFVAGFLAVAGDDDGIHKLPVDLSDVVADNAGRNIGDVDVVTGNAAVADGEPTLYCERRKPRLKSTGLA